MIGAITKGLALWALAAGLAASPYADAESLVLAEGADTEAWDPSRDSARLREEFHTYELTPQPGPPEHVLWRFATRGQAYADVFRRREIPGRFVSLRVRVANPGPALALAVKVGDAHGAEYSGARAPLEAGADWTTIEFPFEELGVAPWSEDPDGRFDYPARYLALIAFDLETGTEYALRVASVEAVLPPPPAVSVAALDAPTSGKPGGGYHFSADLTLRRGPASEAAELRFVQGDTTRFSLPLTLDPPGPAWAQGEERRAWTRGRLPRFAWPGRHSVKLYLDGVPAETEPEGALGSMTLEPREPGPLSAEVRRRGGVPSLFINGSPHSGMMFTSYHPAVRTFKQFAEAGVDLFSFSSTPTAPGYGLSELCWVAPDTFDYSQFDERAGMVLEANPEAFFFPRLYLHAPQWWCEEHPDALVQYDPGDGEPRLFLHQGRYKTPSWASEAWRRDTAEALRRFIAHVESSPFADRCIGYHLASGTTEEWMMWGANENQWVGYSPANTRKFRAWLREKYGTDEALQAAWNDPAVSLDAAAPPLRAERAAARFGLFRDPAREQRSIDFDIYASWLVADTITYLARAVKEYAGQDRLVGAFYGYVLQLTDHRLQNAGHLALREVWESPHIDFLCSPTNYAFREVGGEGTSLFMSPLQGLHRHGKMWFSETDIRTSITEGPAAGQWGKPADVAGDLLQQDKELANVLTNGAAQWWFDVGRIRYDDPRIMSKITQLNRIATENIETPRTPVDEVAVVIDPRSLAFLKVGSPLATHLILNQVPELERMGAPVGYYSLDDLETLAPRRMYVFLTCFAPTPRQRSFIERLKGDGRVLLFVYAQGLYSEDALSPGGPADLAEMDLTVSQEPAPLRVTVNAAMRGGAAGLEYGLAEPLSPIVYCDDPQARNLGALANGACGLAVKQHGDWTSAFSAAPAVPAAVLRELAREAGAHLYCEQDDTMLWASEGMLAVSGKEPGPRVIMLRSPSDVYDLYGGERVGQQVRTFTVDIKPRGTRLFRLSPLP